MKNTKKNFFSPLSIIQIFNNINVKFKNVFMKLLVILAMSQPIVTFHYLSVLDNCGVDEN